MAGASITVGGSSVSIARLSAAPLLAAPLLAAPLLAVKSGLANGLVESKSPASSRFKLAGSARVSSAEADEGVSLNTDPDGLSGSAANADPSPLLAADCSSWAAGSAAGLVAAGLVTDDFDRPSGSSPHTELEVDDGFGLVAGVFDSPSGSSPQIELELAVDLGLVSDVELGLVSDVELGLVSDVDLTCVGFERPSGSSPHTDPELPPDDDTFGVLGSKIDPDEVGSKTDPDGLCRCGAG
jgi:hypothetical protein